MTTGYNVGAAAQAMALAQLQQAQERILRLSLSPRQLRLNYLWAFFTAEQYDERSIAWNGLRVPALHERDGITRATAIPPGFLDHGGLFDAVPLEYRKPDAEHHLVRQVVWRFTDLMFSERTRPRFHVEGDQLATAWLDDMCKATSHWSRWGFARNMAGAMGSACLSFRFVAGRLVLEVHDPRWCTPRYRDRVTGDLDALEIRYMYPEEGRRSDGLPVTIWRWYRRVIDAERDVTFAPAEVRDGDEPIWIEDAAQTFRHGLGFCPVRWVQNTPVLAEVDGEPDCKGVFGNVELMDRLLSQAATGAIHNADPTLHIGTSDQKLEDIKKGSKNAIRTEKDGSVSYVEMSGSGTEAALRVFDKIDQVTMRAVRCILEEEREGGPMTAEEIRRRYGAMFSRVETLQSHWTEVGLVPMAEMIARACRTLSTAATIDPSTGVVTRAVIAGKIGKLPPSVMSGALESHDMQAAAATIEAKWPELAPPTAQDATASATATATAVSAGILDRQTAVEFLAPKFGARDTAEVLKRLDAERAEKAEALASELVAGAAPSASAPGAAPAGPDGAAVMDTALNGAQVESLLEIATQAFNRGLPRASAIAIARAAFPMVPSDLLEVAIPEPRTDVPAAPAPGLEPAPTTPGGIPEGGTF